MYFRCTLVFSLAFFYIAHESSDGNTSCFVKLLTRGLYDKHAHSARFGLNATDHLTMCFTLNIVIIDLYNTVTLHKACSLCWGSRVNIANKLSRFTLFSMQVESISLEVRPGMQDTQPRTRIITAVIFSSSFDEWWKVKFDEWWKVNTRMQGGIKSKVRKTNH